MSTIKEIDDDYYERQVVKLINAQTERKKHSFDTKLTDESLKQGKSWSWRACLAHTFIHFLTHTVNHIATHQSQGPCTTTPLCDRRKTDEILDGLIQSLFDTSSYKYLVMLRRTVFFF